MIPRARRPILGRIRVPLKTLRMSANFVRREVRTIPMHACDPGAILDYPVASNVLNGVQHRRKLLGCARRRGRKDRRCAMPGVSAVDDARRVGRAVHVVAARTAMRMNINESGADVAVASINQGGAIQRLYIISGANRDNPLVFDND